MEMNSRNLKQRSTFHGICSLILTGGLALLQAHVFPAEWVPIITKGLTALGILVGVNGSYDVVRDEKAIKAPVGTIGNTNTNMNMSIIFMLLLMPIMGLMSGCVNQAAVRTNAAIKAGFCQPGEESVILDLIPNAGNVDVILQMGDYAALRNNVYTRAQVEAVFDECEKFLNDFTTDITGAQVVAYVSKKVEWLKKNGAQDIVFLSQYAGKIDLPRILTTCDRRILLSEIAKHRERVLIFF